MFLPIRSKNPPESLPFVTCIVITVNVVVYALTTNGLVVHRSVVESWGLKSSGFDIPHIFSSMFLHADIFHLLGNMWFLYILGFAVEGRLRPPKFALLYLLSGIAGDLLHHFLIGRLHPDLPSLGASGAIMGVMGAALYMFPYGKVTTVYWFFWYLRGIFDCPMWGVACYFLGFDVLFALLSGTSGGGGVGHLIHIGGAIAGFLLAAAFRVKRDSETASDAKATFADTKDLSVLSFVELSEMLKSNPEDTTISLNYIYRAAREGRANDEVVSRLRRMLPRLLDNEPVQSVATCIHMTYQVGDYTPRELIDIAGRLERAPEPNLALKFYEFAYAEPRSKSADHEACLFRVAMLCESSLGNPRRAVATYQALIEQFGMSPLADQARARLSVLMSKAA